MTSGVALVEARRELDAIRERLAANARARLPRSIEVARVGHFDPRPDGTIHYRLVLASPAGRWEQPQTRVDPDMARDLIRLRAIIDRPKPAERLRVYRSVPRGMAGIAA